MSKKTNTDLQKTYPLVTWRNKEILRTVCSPIKKIDKTIIQLWYDMIDLMRAYDWVWLAAPQIWINARMCVVTQRDTKHQIKRWKNRKTERKLLDELVLINPIVLSYSDTSTVDQEACLSLPGTTGDVRRPDAVTIKYTWLDRKEHILKATWFSARVILHEIDHLDGILFIDKLV